MKVIVTAHCYDVGQFLPPVLVSRGREKRQEFGDGLPHNVRLCTN
jgi:hypothetical protein